MLKIKLIIQLTFIALFFLGCSTQKEIPKNYLISPGKIKAQPYGAWISVNKGGINDQGINTEINGELIASNKDTCWILTEKELSVVPNSRIRNATLYLFKKQSNMYSYVTMIGLIPIVLTAITAGAPEFLLIGVPFLIVGIIVSASENSSKNELIYPGKNKLDEFQVFSRFPQGLPPQLDTRKLTLNK